MAGWTIVQSTVSVGRRPYADAAPPAVASRRLPCVSTVNTPPPIDMPAPPPDLVAALRRVGTIFALGVLPVAALVTMFVVGWQGGPLSGDFHHELYPEAKLLLHGHNPFPSPDDEIGGANLVWPPVAAYLVSPLTLLPASAADVVMVLIGLACFALSLWLVGVRDWRIYGVVALWPQFVGEMRVSHLTPVIMLLVAAAWRWRDTRGAPGVLVGLAVAIKFFVWPVGLWLAATRRLADAALAAAVAAASLLLVLPFTGLHDYVDALTRLGRVFDQDSYNVYGLLVQAGASDAPHASRCSSSARRSSQGRGGTGASRSRSRRPSRSPPSSGSTTSRSPRCRSRWRGRG